MWVKPPTLTRFEQWRIAMPTMAHAAVEVAEPGA
jgi:hypothetical protein